MHLFATLYVVMIMQRIIKLVVVSRDLKQITKVTATRKSPNKRFNEQNNGFARAL